MITDKGYEYMHDATARVLIGTNGLFIINDFKDKTFIFRAESITGDNPTHTAILMNRIELEILAEWISKYL